MIVFTDRIDACFFAQKFPEKLWNDCEAFSLILSVRTYVIITVLDRNHFESIMIVVFVEVKVDELEDRGASIKGGMDTPVQSLPIPSYHL